MKICRVHENGEIFFAALEDDDSLRRLDREPLDPEAQPSGAPFPRSSVQLLAPVVPGKIVCVGRNYAAHARELGNQPPAEPLLFLKPPSSVIGPDDTIRRPAISDRVDFEGELAIVIGRRARDVEPSGWRSHVLGFTCANDVTARDLQKKDVQFTRAKGFDTFCPLGPWIDTELDIADVRLETRVDGTVRQQSSTSRMIFPPGELISYISRIMTLEPRDVILTGTPEGVGSLLPGEIVEVEIEGLGVLRNRVG